MDIKGNLPCIWNSILGGDYMIKNKLLDIRLEMKYKTQKEFANFLNINIKTYSQIENNKKQVSLENAFIISTKLNLKIEDIWQYSKD